MKSPKEGINPPFTPDWKAYEHIVNANEYFAEQHCAVVSKQQRERAPMRRPHLPANTTIKAFTNLRRKRQSSLTSRTAHLDRGWDVPQLYARISCTRMCFLLQVLLEDSPNVQACAFTPHRMSFFVTGA